MIRKIVEFTQKIIKKTPFSKELSEELDDHRESLNQHDEELKELYSTVEKLKESLEEHKIMLGNTSFFGPELNLSFDEKRILLILYANDCLLNAKDIARKLRMEYYIVDDLLDDLGLKGIPIIKQKSLHNEMFYSLHQKFKDLQAKENVLRITSAVSQRMLQETLI